MDPKKKAAIDELWQTILERAGIERDDDAVGPPTHIPENLGFAWFPIGESNKASIIEPNKPCPFNPKVDVFAIFHDSPETRIYALGEGGGYRWTVSRETPTRYLQKLSMQVFIDCCAADVLLAEAEFDVLDADKVECTACGAENDEDAVFCKECGAEMGPPKVEPNGASDDNAAPPV
jgi:zinc-ribbon domain